MVRWEPGTKERLQAAALELYLARGFDRTTVAEIAAAAGLTERTFFRHFADKREVLFQGQEELLDVFLRGLDDVPPGAPPLTAMTAALASSASWFPAERREWSRRRQLVIDATPALRERELLKLALLATALAQALRDRGAPPAAAALAAESGITVFGVAFLQWIADGETRTFGEVQAEVLGELRAMTAA